MHTDELRRVQLGSIDVYRAELRGGDSTLDLWVSKAKPHRLMKLAVQGAPMEWVRAQ